MASRIFRREFAMAELAMMLLSGVHHARLLTIVWLQSHKPAASRIFVGQTLPRWSLLECSRSMSSRPGVL